MSKSDEYYTPKWIFDGLGLVFDIDPSHPECKTNVPTKEYFTKNDNGLEKKWEGNIWMNPPFSEATLWVRKFMLYRNGIALLPFAKSKWLNEIWDDCDSVLPLPSNLKFIHEEKSKGSIFLAAGLFGYGVENIKALKKLDIGLTR